MAKSLGNQMQEADSDEEEPDSDEDDFFRKTQKEREIASDEELQAAPKVSKSKLRKITADGPYQGKNVTVFTEDGQ